MLMGCVLYRVERKPPSLIDGRWPIRHCQLSKLTTIRIRIIQIICVVSWYDILAP